jgi:hypothetical protein
LIGLVLLGLRFPLLNPPYPLEVVQLLFGGEVSVRRNFGADCCVMLNLSLKDK